MTIDRWRRGRLAGHSRLYWPEEASLSDEATRADDERCSIGPHGLTSGDLMCACTLCVCGIRAASALGQIRARDSGRSAYRRRARAPRAAPTATPARAGGLPAWLTRGYTAAYSGCMNTVSTIVNRIHSEPSVRAFPFARVSLGSSYIGDSYTSIKVQALGFRRRAPY